METNQLAATAPEQTTAAPETSESAPEPVIETKSVEEPKQETEPEWFTKRFGEITAKFRDAERRALTAEQRLATYEQQRPQKEPEKPKTLADFDYDEGKFHSYVIEEARKAAAEAATRADDERQARTQAERRFRKFQEREISFEKETKDYRDVAHYAPISERVAEIIQDMEAGPEVAYFLGKNRDIALTLNDLPPHIAAIELGRIDARLGAERKAKTEALEKAKAAKAVTQAPEPPPRIEGAGDHSTVKSDEPESDKLSDAEWLRRRNKQVSRRS